MGIESSDVDDVQVLQPADQSKWLHQLQRVINLQCCEEVYQVGVDGNVWNLFFTAENTFKVYVWSERIPFSPL